MRALPLLLLLALPAHAEQTLTLEGGASVLRDEQVALGLTITCPQCGPSRTSIEYGMDYVGDWPRNDVVQNVIQLRTQLVAGWRRLEGGLGLYWHNAETGNVCRFGFHLMGRYRATERLSVQWRHSSSAGSCAPNFGLDLLTVGYRF